VGDFRQIGPDLGAVTGLRPRQGSAAAVPVGHDAPDLAAGVFFSVAAPGERRARTRPGPQTAADAVFGQAGGYPEESEDEVLILAAAAEDPTAAAGEAAPPRTSSLWWVSACIVALLAHHARGDRYAHFSPPSL
jgi:hypothetical protein